MSLREYRDDFVEAELGHRFGAYLKSYSAAGGLVEIHLFEDGRGQLVAFLTKAGSIPLHIAQDLAHQALATISAINGGSPRVVIDAGSIPTSGSL